jgi:uncharacterized ion transporter superfamily protein YfcC
MRKTLMKLTIVTAILAVISYVSPKGQYLEIKDKSGITYKAMFHKGTLSYVIFKDEENLSKGVVDFIWRWNVESVKVFRQK